MSKIIAPSSEEVTRFGNREAQDDDHLDAEMARRDAAKPKAGRVVLSPEVDYMFHMLLAERAGITDPLELS